MAQIEKNENKYRSQRKERLAKTSKKKTKKQHDSTALVRGIIIAICVVVLIAAVGGGLYVYGVPQKLIPAAKVGDRSYSIAEYSYYYTSVYQTYANQSYETKQQYGVSLGFDYTKDPAAQTTKDDDGNSITYADYFKSYVLDTLESYNYYLNKAKAENVTISEENKAAIEDTINELATYAKQYGYSADRYISVLYGKGLNLKTFRSLLEDQYIVSQYTTAENDAAYDAITEEQLNEKYNEDPSAYTAVDLRLFGFEIGADDNAEGESTTAAEAGTTAEATTAAESTVADTTAAPTTAADTTTTADTTTASDTTAAESTTAAQKADPTAQELLAQEMLNKITDESSFADLAREYCAEEDKDTFKDDSATIAIGITKATVKSNIDEDLAEWLFSADRKVGDKTVCTTDKYVYVIYVKNTSYRNETPLVSARHILVSFESVAETLKETEVSAENTKVEEITADDGTVVTNDGTDYSMNVVLSAYEQAKDILEQYNATDKTEEEFAKLAEANSKDTASIGDNGEGGLYTDITKGQMVAPFENWVYDESRQPGDTGLVMSNYGWHVMYFVSAHDEAPWVETIKNSIVSDQQKAIEEQVKADTDGTASETGFTAFAAKKALELINKLYVSSNAANATNTAS